ncbi:MAG: hypothetical protein Q9217_005078 [Psora testacea]
MPDLGGLKPDDPGISTEAIYGSGSTSSYGSSIESLVQANGGNSGSGPQGACINGQCSAVSGQGSVSTSQSTEVSTGTRQGTVSGGGSGNGNGNGNGATGGQAPSASAAAAAAPTNDPPQSIVVPLPSGLAAAGAIDSQGHLVGEQGTGTTGGNTHQVSSAPSVQGYSGSVGLQQIWQSTATRSSSPCQTGGRVPSGSGTEENLGSGNSKSVTNATNNADVTSTPEYRQYSGNGNGMANAGGWSAGANLATTMSIPTTPGASSGRRRWLAAVESKLFN